MANIDINAAPNVQGALDTTQAKPEDFGAGQLEGAASSAMAMTQQVMAAKIKMNTRRDTVNRARAKNEYVKTLDAEYNRRIDEVDMTDPAQAEDFSRWASDKGMEMLENHDGMPNSKATLSTILDDHRSSYTRQFSREVIASGKKFIQDETTTGIAEIANDVMQTGDIDAANKLVDMLIDDNAAAMDPNMERDFRRMGYQSNITSGFQAAMDANDLDAAKNIINMKDINKIMEPPQLQKMRAAVTKEDYARTKGAREAQQVLDKAQNILGRPVTDAERVRLAGLEPTSGRKTLRDEVNEFTEVFGRAPDETEMARLAGTYAASADAAMSFNEKIAGLETIVGDLNAPEIVAVQDVIINESMKPSQRLARISALRPDLTEAQKESILRMDFTGSGGDIFGKGLKGRSMVIAGDLAAGFATDSLSPEDTRKFQNAISALTQPMQTVDEFGNKITVPGMAVPQYIKDAYNARGMEIPEVSQAGPMSFDADDASLEIPAPSNFETLYSLAESGTGLGSALTRAVGGTPIIGDIARAVDSAPFDKAEQSATRINAMVNDLVTVLQNNPRFAEGERQQIKQDLTLNPAVLDTVGAYRNRVIGISDELEQMQDRALKIRQAKSSTLEERQTALREFNAISNFIDRLGAPPIVKSQEELKELPPGAPFRVIINGNSVVKYNTPVQGAQ